nr:serine protease inhibitor 2-like [Ipomoea trifida]
MNALLLFVTLLSFVPFAFSSTLELPTSSPAVLDIEGQEVKCGVPYYVFSSAFIFQMGLCLSDVKNQTTGCPHDVVQCSINLNKPKNLGMPIILKSVNATTDPVVRENAPHLFRFPVIGLTCIHDVVWYLKDALTFWKIVTTDPAAAPGPAAAFQIQRDGPGYKIAYCASIPPPISTSVCFGLGFLQDGLNRRLGVGLGVDSVNFFFTRNASAVENLATSLLASY